MFKNSKAIISCIYLAITLTASSLMAAPEAIVFDFGGVLTGQANREAVVQFIQTSFNLTPDEFNNLQQRKREALKQGQTDEGFWLSYAKTQGIKLPEHWVESLKAAMRDAIGINPQMLSLVEELRGQQLTVALLSNIDERLAKVIREFGWYQLFDPCLLSFELGIEKPDAKIYEILLDRLHLPGSEVVFIDDREENVEAAKKMGIDAILFESAQQIREELSLRGVKLK